MRRIAEGADVSMTMANQGTWIPAPEAVRALVAGGVQGRWFIAAS